MIDVARLQTRLKAAGYDPGPIDGAIGAKTYGALFNFMAVRDLGDRGRLLGQGAAKHFPPAAIDSNRLRVAHFLAQSSAETLAFRYMREIWGPTAAQKRYEGRTDLGNVIRGDGKKFLGRGIFQITGRYNYEHYGKLLGLDLADHPELAESPEVAMQIAVHYWSDHRLNEWADTDNILGTSNGINRGNPASIKEPNGFTARKAALARAKLVLL